MLDPLDQQASNTSLRKMLCWAAGGPQKYTGRSMKDLAPRSYDHGRKWEAFLR